MKFSKSAFFLILAAMITVWGCDLEENPHGFTSSENFYKSREDATSAIAYAYAIMGDIEYYPRSYWLVNTIPTEEFTIKPDAPITQHNLDQLRPNPSNDELTNTFRYAYIGINRANYVIEEVPGITSMDSTYRDQVVGEAYFLRALHHFNLVRLFGDVPMHTSRVDQIENVSSPIVAKAKIYEQIISDLETAADKMDELNYRHGRANVVAAWGLLAKVHLFMASAADNDVPGYDFVSDIQGHYDDAATWASKVMNDQSRFSFDPDLKHIFSMEAEDGPERIFNISMNREGEQEGMYSKQPLFVIPYIDGGTINLLDGTSVPSGFDHVWVEMPFYNSFMENDKRRTELMVDSVVVSGDTLSYQGGGLDRPFTRKILDPNQEGQQTGYDYPVMRYSDILLVYAEAEGPTSQGYQAVNKVRQRAGIGDLPSGLSTEAFRDSVIKERSWEMAFEGQRLFDLRRTGKMNEVLENQYGKTIQSNAYYFDIPQVEQDVNEEIN